MTEADGHRHGYGAMLEDGKRQVKGRCAKWGWWKWSGDKACVDCSDTTKQQELFG